VPGERVLLDLQSLMSRFEDMVRREKLIQHEPMKYFACDETTMLKGSTVSYGVAKTQWPRHFYA
jgi:hypothetical protein